MNNLTQEEFNKICEDIYTKTRRNLYDALPKCLEKINKQEIVFDETDTPMEAILKYRNHLIEQLYTLNVDALDKAFDLSCRYSQEILSRVLYDSKQD